MLLPVLRRALVLMLVLAASVSVADERPPGNGSLIGQVFDGETGKPVEGVAVTVTWPVSPEGREPRTDVDVTDREGEYKFESLPPGSYTLRFTKSGYRDATTPDFTVAANQTLRADTPLPPLATWSRCSCASPRTNS
jgi:protocatechuate 3,4-dioxygenase beta subunit